MKAQTFLACTTAALALAACNKSNTSEHAAPPANVSVTVTQAAPPPGGTWADVANATSAGGVMMGNPNAKVKLIEIGSLSCPHCKAFDDEGVPKLIADYVKPGKVSWEFRPYIIHGPIDMAADLVVRCAGTKDFFALVQAMYHDQAALMSKLDSTPQAKLAQIQNLPTNQVFVAMATVMGLQDWAALRGVPQARSNQCLGNEKMINQEVQYTADVNTQFPQFGGTPAFAIDGTMLSEDTTTWDQLKPQLDKALQR